MASADGLRKFNSSANSIHHHSLFTAKSSDVSLVAAYNKSTAFSLEERDTLKLRGLLPPVVETLDLQARRALLQLRSFANPFDKYVYLQSLQNRNITLFFKIIIENLSETMPIIYTPTVGQGCLEFAHNWRTAQGMYFSIQDKGHFREMCDNWPSAEVDIIVVTDGSRILGLGDLGANGMGIPVGKLSLYVAGAGFHPLRTLPVTLDVGTNNAGLLEDELYIGVRQRRPKSSEEFYAITDEFMAAVHDKWPNALVQFEDFSNDHCFDLLERYRNKYLCFNDDIQGTGAVILAGFLNAVKITGTNLLDHRIVFYGAGSAAVGVADQIVSVMTESGVSEEEARTRFYFVDSRGLVTADRGDELAAHKRPYARTDNGGRQLGTLAEVVAEFRPTALVGLAGQGPAFDADMLRQMGEHAERPIVMALSNPTSKAECTAEQAYVNTDGRAVFASGSPFDPVTLADGRVLVPGQGNNMYIFPGLGYGAVLGRAARVSDKMIIAAAKTLADSVAEEDLRKGLMYPPLSCIRAISARISAAVMRTAKEEGHIAELPAGDLEQYVVDSMYLPEYAGEPLSASSAARM